MEMTEFEMIVKEMRDEQRLYFRTRDKEHLQRAKELERRVDWILEERMKHAD